MVVVVYSAGFQALARWTQTYGCVVDEAQDGNDSPRLQIWADLGRAGQYTLQALYLLPLLMWVIPVGCGRLGLLTGIWQAGSVHERLLYAVHAVGDISRLLPFPTYPGRRHGGKENLSCTQIVPLRTMEGFLVDVLESCAAVALVQVCATRNEHGSRKLRPSRTSCRHLLTIIVIAPNIMIHPVSCLCISQCQTRLETCLFVAEGTPWRRG